MESTLKKTSVELLKLGKKAGDTGTTAMQELWINEYLEALLYYLTPEAVASFGPVELRALYVIWFTHYVTTADLAAARGALISHLEITPVPRIVAAAPTDANVVSFFNRKA